MELSYLGKLILSLKPVVECYVGTTNSPISFLMMIDSERSYDLYQYTAETLYIRVIKNIDVSLKLLYILPLCREFLSE